MQSISPPYLLDQGRRRRRGAARVHLTEAPPLVVLDRIGSRGGEASTTTSPTFRRTFRCANLQGYEDLIQSLSLIASPRLDLGFPLFASVENFDLLCRETLQKSQQATGSSQRHEEPALEAASGPDSARKSSVASTENVQPTLEMVGPR